MKLVIVESPTKSRTLQGFLGPEYRVLSSYGHVRDLPKKELGVDVERDFKPQYIIIPKAKKQIKTLKDSAEKAESIILATDEDREGEAIAWHLVEALGLDERKAKSEKRKTVERIVFHEITKKAIEEALENPRDIDINLVDAQQARRILDRLVGYKLSPFLWKKVVRGLSAGRVQSVAVRLIVEREREIEKFVSEEYWTIVASLLKIKNQKSLPCRQAGKIKNNEFDAILTKINGEIIPRFGVKTKEEAEKILKDLEGAEYRVENVEKKEIEKYPLPPYITSTLQQDAWRRLRFSTKQTMRIAQQLYEGINLGKGPVGLITYMRTDSVNLSKNSQYAAKEFIEKEFGENYHSWRTFKTKSRLAQEAHEAIRPTDPKRTPESIKEHLDARQYKLYDTIWRRFIASQMSSAHFDSTIINIKANPFDKLRVSPEQSRSTKTCNLKPTYIFRATGQIMKFDGFLKVYPMRFEESELPELTKDEILELIKLIPEQHFTQPPARFSEATLVKTLEKEGIGRPSTYAPIMSTIQGRGYIEKDERKYFKPTEIGVLVNDLLVEHFPKVVDIKFTANMEEDLDKIAEGHKEWVPTVKEFYGPFEKNLEEKYQEVEKQDLTEETEEVCEKCGKPMVIKFGKFGKFIACSGYPQCKNTKPLEKSTGVKCPKCDQGEIIEKKSKRGKLFFGCNQWPKCDFALWHKPVRQAQGEPTGEKCPECNSLLVEERRETRCSNKECQYVKT